MSAKNGYAVFLLLCSFFLAATSTAQLQKIYLQPKTTAREKQSKYVDSIRFIPLEVKEGIEVGAYYYTLVTDKYLIVVDYLNRRLIVYTKEGGYVKNIKYNKLGENFYPSYRQYKDQVVFYGSNKNYALTAKDRIQIELDWANPRNKKYFVKYIVDLADSSLLLQKVTPEERDILGVYHYYDDYYLQRKGTTSTLYKDSLSYELKLYHNNQLVKSFFPYNQINEPRFLYAQDAVTATETDTPFIKFIVRPFCDTIYKMVKDSVFPVYQLVLPLENSLPASFFTRPFKNKVERDNFNRNNGWMLHHVFNYYETPRLTLLTMAYLSNYESYVYERGKNIFYNVKNIKTDSSQYNLELLSDPGTVRHGNRFYKAARAKDILPFFEANKKVPVPKELEAFVNSKPPGNTPLIVEYQFKN